MTQRASSGQSGEDWVEQVEIVDAARARVTVVKHNGDKAVYHLPRRPLIDIDVVRRVNDVIEEIGVGD